MTFHTQAFMTPEARAEAASLPKSRRQEMIKTLLYPYPVFKSGVQFIKDFHQPGGDEGYDSGAIGALTGESHAGKSVICRYYGSLFPNGVSEEGETYPIVYVEATEHMTLQNLAERIYYQTGARSIPNVKNGALRDNAILRLAAAKTQLVILDEAQLLICDRPVPQIKAFRSYIKQMVDANLFNVLLVGEERLETTVHSMEALANRGFYHERIKAIGDSGTEFDMFRLLIDKIDDRLPFAAKSRLEVWARDFHHFSGGKIGRLMRLVERAGLIAMGQDTSCIMVEHLRETVNRMRGPGDRYPYFEKG